MVMWKHCLKQLGIHGTLNCGLKCSSIPDSFFCFSEVVIIQSHLNGNAARMEDAKIFAKIFVVNTDTDIVHLCGVLKVGPVMTIEGQTYHIPCQMRCGNEVKVTLQHDRGFYSRDATIHMREISAFA